MKKTAWKNRIKKMCEEAGTYQPCFDDSINSLAIILQERDKSYDLYIKKGGLPCINHTNKAGATNVIKNPLLVSIMDLNSQALSYWRDLGLTPAGLKKINDAAVKKNKNASSVDSILSGLGF